MIPAGYLLKRIRPRPEWLHAEGVVDICSVSDCQNDTVVEIETTWRHNAFGVANDPEMLWQLAREGGVDISDVTLFYYEAYEQEIDSEEWRLSPPAWRPLSPVPSGQVAVAPVVAPRSGTLMGYDVVVAEDFLEHSPLFCNSIAQDVPVNAHCLFDTLDQARAAIEAGAFNDCEPGVYKIYSVHRVHTDGTEGAVA